MAEYPDFAFLIIVLDGKSAEGVEQMSIPGAIALYDDADQPLGWG